MALLLVGSLAFSTGAFAYTAGQIEGTTGTGIAKDPIKVNTFAEFKAAMENNEIEYVELGDVDGEDGLVITDEKHIAIDGRDFPSYGVFVGSPKKLMLTGSAVFTQTALAHGLILLGADLEVSGNGSLTYQLVTGKTFYANTIFNVILGTLHIRSGSFVAKNHQLYGNTYGYVLTQEATTDNLVVIDDGFFKGEAATAAVDIRKGVVRGGRFEMIGGDGMRLVANDDVKILGGSFEILRFRQGALISNFIPTESVLKNNAGAIVNKEGDVFFDVSVETSQKYFLTINSTNGGSIMVRNPAEFYYSGEPVHLKAVPKDGFVFTGWKRGDVILSEERDFALTMSSDEEITGLFANQNDVSVVNGVVYTVYVECDVPQSNQSVGNCVSKTPGTKISALDWYNYQTGLVVNVFAESGVYKVHTIIMLDDGYSFFDNPKVIYNGNMIGEKYAVSNRYVNFFATYVLNMYRVTFKDPAGNVISTSTVAVGNTPEMPSITVKEDSEEFHYFAKCTPEIVPVTEDAEYVAELDSVLKDPAAYITVKYEYNGGISWETNSECVMVEPNYIDLDSKRYFFNEDGSIDLTLGDGDYKFAFDVKVGLNQCDDFFAKSLRYYDKTTTDFYVNGIRSESFAYVSENPDDVYWMSYKFDFSIASYSVTFFDDKGVQVGDVVTVASGMAVGAPAEPAKREGYTFAGWFQKDAETAYDFSAAVNEDLELYGKWTVNKYEIAVAANDSKMGSVKGAGTYEYGTEVELVATAAKGYKFSNWEDDVKASATRKVKVTAAASYKAVFEEIATNSSSSSVIPGGSEESSSSSAKAGSSSSKKTDANSSSSAKNGSSSSVIPSGNEKSSSSSAKANSSSSSKMRNSSSSAKKDAVVATAAVPQFSVAVVGRNVQIAGARIGSAYAIFDMQGRVLATGRTASTSMEIAVPRAGSYMVRVGSRTQRVNVK